MSVQTTDTVNDLQVKHDLPVRIYSAEQKEGALGILISFARMFAASHALGFLFAKRNIISRYRQSLLGIFWAFLPPIATGCVWIILYQSKVINLRDVGAPYPVFVITGTLLWSVFANSVLIPLQIVQGSRSILVKINFPREALLVNAFYEILFNAGVALVIVIAELLIFNVEVNAQALLFIPAVFLLIFLGIGVGLLLLPFSLLFRDIQFVLPSVLQFAMYLTPVVYAKPLYEGSTWILNLNPVTPVLTSARAWLLNIPDYTPGWQIGAVAGAALLLFFIGIIMYRLTLSILIERMGT